jgi:hypothetical protein
VKRLSPGEADRVVFATGDPDSSYVTSYFERLPNLLLEKPIDLVGLEALIERRIRRRSSELRTA